MNKELGEHKSVQNLENLEQLSNEQIDELRLFFTKKTGIHQKADCGGCVKVWAKLYRNHYNAQPAKVVEPTKDIKDGKSEGKKDKK